MDTLRGVFKALDGRDLELTVVFILKDERVNPQPRSATGTSCNARN